MSRVARSRRTIVILGDISPYPARCYEDIADPDDSNYGNYTLNETAVNIQASLIVLAGYFSSGGAPTDVAISDAGGAASARLAIWPNPFRVSTIIRWSAPREIGASRGARTGVQAPLDGGARRTDRVALVFDAAGRRVARLVAPVRPGESREVVWDGLTDDGTLAASGTYFVRIDGAPMKARRITLVR